MGRFQVTPFLAPSWSSADLNVELRPDISCNSMLAFMAWGNLGFNLDMLMRICLESSSNKRPGISKQLVLRFGCALISEQLYARRSPEYISRDRLFLQIVSVTGLGIIALPSKYAHELELGTPLDRNVTGIVFFSFCLVQADSWESHLSGSPASFISSNGFDKKFDMRLKRSEVQHAFHWLSCGIIIILRRLTA